MIMDFFPKHLSPRPVQEAALLQIQEAWNKADVLVVNLPVASGKSAISMTLAAWAKKASIITPSRLLVDQYVKEYPKLHVLRGKRDFWCDLVGVNLAARPMINKKKLCDPIIKCKGCDKYRMDVKKSHVMPYLISNYYVYIYQKLHRETLIVDEAHNLIKTLKDLAAKRLWKFKHQYGNITTREQLRQWINSLPPERFDSVKMKKNKITGEMEEVEVNMMGLKELKEELNSTRPKYLFQATEAMYKGEMRECVEFLPLDIRNNRSNYFVWPSMVKKIVLLSATLSRKDIEQLGLSGRKVQYIEADSPIQAQRRPVIIPGEAADMSFRNQDMNLPLLAEYIRKVADINHDVKGLIHATYSLAEKLQKHFKDDTRFLFHTKTNKTDVYNSFRQTKEPKILVASGMYEGIDLPFDAGRWQILAKVPFPNLGDPATKYMADADPEFYAWETIKVVLQSCGRICRDPSDYGETFIFDKSFIRLYNNNPEFYPQWYKNSVINESEIA